MHAFVVSVLRSCFPEAHLFDSASQEVLAAVTMTILGFRFSSNHNISAHFNYIRGKFRARLWALRHLRRNGFSDDDLLKVFVGHTAYTSKPFLLV